MRKIAIILLVILFVKTANGQWKRLPINGGYINAFTQTSNRIFVGTDDGGAFYSENEGLNWKMLPGSFSNNKISALCAFGDTVYLGTVFGGLFKSYDNGNTWFKAHQFDYNASIFGLFEKDSCLFACTNGGLYASKGFGNDWARSDSGFDWRQYLRVIQIISHHNILFAISNIGVYCSYDNGTTWSEKNTGITFKNAFGIVSFGGKLYMGNAFGIFVSDNNGQNWVRKNYGLVDTTILSMTTNGISIFAGTNKKGTIYELKSGDSVWTNISGNFTNSRVNALMVKGNYLYAGTYMGISRYNLNTKTWIKCNEDLSAVSVPSMTVKNRHLLISKYSSGLSNYSIDSLSNIDLLGDYNTTCITEFNNVCFISFWDDRIKAYYFSADNGYTFLPLNSGISSYSITTHLETNSQFLVGNSTGNVFVSTNNGGNWTLNKKGLFGSVISSFSNLGSKYYLSNYSGVFYKELSDTSWTKILSLVPDTVNVIKATPKLLLAGTQNHGLMISSDTGITWHAADTLHPALNVLSIYLVGDTFFIGTTSGVLMSTDTCKSWKFINLGLRPGTLVNCFTYEYPKLYAGTNFGVWELDLNKMPEAIPEQLPDLSIKLYPNPCSDFVVLETNDLRNQRNTLTIINMNGQTLFKESNNGFSSKKINLSDFAAGEYFLIIENGNKSVCKKFIHMGVR